MLQIAPQHLHIHFANEVFQNRQAGTRFGFVWLFSSSWSRADRGDTTKTWPPRPPASLSGERVSHEIRSTALSWNIFRQHLSPGARRNTGDGFLGLRDLLPDAAFTSPALHFVDPMSQFSIRVEPLSKLLVHPCSLSWTTDTLLSVRASLALCLSCCVSFRSLGDRAYFRFCSAPGVNTGEKDTFVNICRVRHPHAFGAVVHQAQLVGQR